MDTMYDIFIVVLAIIVIYRQISVRVMPLPVGERQAELIRMWPTFLLIAGIVLLVVLSPLFITMKFSIFHQ